MGMREAEAIAKIQCDIGIENVMIRRVSLRGWAIVHPISNCQADVIYEAKTEHECKELLAKIKEV